MAVVVVVAVLTGVIIFIMLRKRRSSKRQPRKKVNSSFAEQKPLKTPSMSYNYKILSFTLFISIWYIV